MTNLANSIENYIKRLLEASPSAAIVLQRRELAERFSCVPSQINYVLSTRFPVERGYLVESRRGGGGYLRIRRLDLSKEKVVRFIEYSRDLAGDGVTLQEANAFIDRLTSARIITRREGMLMKAALCNEFLAVEPEDLQRVRAGMLACMLEALLQEL